MTTRLTQVQHDLIELARKQGGTVTPREARANIPDLERRMQLVKQRESVVAGFNSDHDNTPIWHVFRQLEAKGLLKRSTEVGDAHNGEHYRQGSTIFYLIEK